MRRVLVLEEAAQDLEMARDFYDTRDTREIGVGSYCVDSLLSDIESLSLFHGIHPVYFACHRMLASRFPFGIYYVDTAEQTRVVAVLDLRRDPSWIHREIRRRSS